MARPNYVLVTPARNEAQFLGLTLASVIAQTHRPLKWVIVSDASTDATDDLVREAAANHPFIELVRREADVKRAFSSKVFAIREGVKKFEGMPYDYIGNLDADLSFEPTYFEELFSRMEAAPKLGIAGGMIHERESITGHLQLIETDKSVAGAVQMFRRACYEQIGGYIPLRYGGIDAAAEFNARMHGWETRTYMDLLVGHHRRMGSAGRGIFLSFYDMGIREAALGYHPLFEVFRSANRMSASPMVIGGIVQFAGYVLAKIRREPIALSPECVKHLHKEQMARLKGFFGLKQRSRSTI